LWTQMHHIRSLNVLLALRRYYDYESLRGFIIPKRDDNKKILKKKKKETLLWIQ